MGSTSGENRGPLLDEERLSRALALDVAYPERLHGSGGSAASVLILFAKSRTGVWSLLYVQRAASAGPHSGQMAFPGGKAEAGESTAETALRETEEEVGIARNDVRVLGELSSLRTVTGFQVTPVIGILLRALEDVVLRPDPREIAGTLWAPWEQLSRPETYRREFFQLGPARYPIHVYELHGHRIWGATGTMTKNLLDRLSALG